MRLEHKKLRQNGITFSVPAFSTTLLTARSIIMSGTAQRKAILKADSKCNKFSKNPCILGTLSNSNSSRFYFEKTMDAQCTFLSRLFNSSSDSSPLTLVVLNLSV